MLQAFLNRRAHLNWVLSRSAGMENSRPDGAQAAVTQLFKEELFLAAHARRRRMLAVATILRPGKGPQGEKTAPTWAPFSWTKHMNRLDEKDFKLRYRVTVCRCLLQATGRVSPARGLDHQG